MDYLRHTFSFPLGFYLNPDEVDRELAESGRLVFGNWGIRVDGSVLSAFIANHPLNARASIGQFSVSDNALVLNNSVSSGYLASILSDFLRRHWLEAGESFTFETVMSSRDKLGLIAAARKVGYRTYLYYVCTDAVMINTERVANRVLNGGHSVAEDKIQARYERSLSFLPEAIRLSDRAFLFDNSGSSHRLVGEFELGRPIKIEDNPPGWVTAL